MTKDDLWDEVYNMNAFGLADYLNQWFKDGDFRSTQHGEKVWIRLITGEAEDVFNRWDLWRSECSYYFSGHDWAYEEKDILVHGLCAVLHILEDCEEEWFLHPEYPVGHEEYLFM